MCPATASAVPFNAMLKWMKGLVESKQALTGSRSVGCWLCKVVAECDFIVEPTQWRLYSTAEHCRLLAGYGRVALLGGWWCGHCASVNPPNP